MGMSVLVVSEVYWPEGSGGELATYLWVEALVREGVEVTVVTGTKAPARTVGTEYVILDELRVRSRYSLWRVLKGLTNEFRSLIRDSDILYIPRLAWPLVNVAREVGRASVIHLHDYSIIDPTGFVLVNGAPRASKALVLGPLGTLKYLISKHPWSRVVKSVLMANAYVCVSRRQLSIVASRLPQVASKLRYVPNPLPPRSAEVGELPTEVREPYVVFPGGYSLLKGYHIVREVSKLLRGEVEVVVTKAGTSGVVRRGGITYVPRVRHGDYVALLRNSAALLHPSIWEEPMPYAVVEAASMGVPVVATAVGGVPEVLGEDYPLLVNPRDAVSGCVRAIREVLRGGVVREVTEVVARRLRERLDASKLVKELIRVFNEASRGGT